MSCRSIWVTCLMMVGCGTDVAPQSGGTSQGIATSGSSAAMTPTPTPRPTAPPPAAGGAPSAAGQRAPASAGGGGMSQASGGAGMPAPATPSGERFSFFVTSLSALQDLSGSESGFGGDLRFGETGEQAGLRGADKICTQIAERSMPGSGSKQWRAFLSIQNGPSGAAVHAIDRVGEGPWYDRLGRLVSMTKADLMQARPASADMLIKNDLPNEDGVPNKNPDATGEVDNHHMLTGSTPEGRLSTDDPAGATCSDWTSKEREGAPIVGLSWPRGGGAGGRGGRPGGMMGTGMGAMPGGGGPGGMSGAHWISAMRESGCAPGVSLVQMGGPDRSNPSVGSGGGYGGFYCFALSP